MIVDENRTSLLSVECLCGVFSVSRSGFYDWAHRMAHPLVDEVAKRQMLEAAVIRVHFESRNIYGYRKVHRVLLSEGIEVSDKMVYFFMAKNDLHSKTRKAYKPQTTQSNHKNKISPRIFQIEQTLVSKTNEVWAGDITYIATKEGWLYLSIFIDLFSRRAIGWAIADHMRAELVRKSFMMAVKGRHTSPGLIVHSDQGVQYTAGHYRNVVEILEFEQSMSRRGNCYDNAFVESFFSQMKKELSQKIFETKSAAKKEILDYIDSWYNKKRIHSSLGYITPQEFESNFERIAS